MKITPFFEWRVGGNQMNGLAVYSAQEVEIVTVIEGAACEIGFDHFSLLSP